MKGNAVKRLMGMGLALCASGGVAQASALEAELARHTLVQDGACLTGQDAFAETVHPLLRSTCFHCHDLRDGRSNGPRFALEDPGVSYELVRRYVNFADIPSSILVTKGGNQHCVGYGIECGVDFAMVQSAVQAWWDGGEKDCPRKGSYVTAAMPVPADLPTRDEGFKTLRWDLGSIRDDLRGAVFEVEAQRFVDPTETTRGAYRFRKPRFATANGAYEVGGIKILVNGKLDPLANAFARIDQVVRPQAMPSALELPLAQPVLSSTTLLVVQDTEPTEQLAVSFDTLDPAMPRACRDLPMFQSQVKPVLEARNCYACHAGGEASEPGREPAKSRLPMNVGDAELCARLLERSSFDNPIGSIALDYAFRGKNEHPRVIPRQTELEPAWTGWVRSEAAKRLISYQDVKSTFEMCSACHNPDTYSGKLDLESRPFRSDTMGTDQNAIMAKVIERVNDTGEHQMPPPPNEALAPEQIDFLGRWLSDGMVER